MNTIFMNFKTNGTSDLHRILLSLTDKIKLNKTDKYVALSNLCIYDTWKKIKKSYKNSRLKISAPTWNKNLNYLMDHVLYQIFKIILKTS